MCTRYDLEESKNDTHFELAGINDANLRINSIPTDLFIVRDLHKYLPRSHAYAAPFRPTLRVFESRGVPMYGQSSTWKRRSLRASFAFNKHFFGFENAAKN